MDPIAPSGVGRSMLHPPVGLRARGLAKWLQRVFGTSFGHGSELVEAIVKEAEGVCFVDSSDSDNLLRWVVAQGWVASTGFKPSFQQRVMGMGGGSAVPAYLSAHGWSPCREHETAVCVWCASAS